MIPLWLTGAAQGVTGLLGTPEQQRAREERLAAAEIERLYREATLALGREQLAETRRLHDLPDQPTDISGDINAARAIRGLEPLPGPINVRRGSVPAMISAVGAEPKYQTVDELMSLGVIKPPPIIRQAMGQTPGEAGLPELSDVTPTEMPTSVRDVAAEAARGRIKVHPEIAREIGQQWKAADTERRQNQQRLSTARYREIYSRLRDANTPHFLADATANAMATKEFGIAPEYQGLVPAPTERDAPKMSLEDEYLGIKKAKPTGPYTPYEDLVIKQYDTQRAKRERGMTMVDLALEQAGGDTAKAIEILQRGEQRSKEGIERRASFILEEARRQVTASRNRIEAINQTPEQFNTMVQKSAQQLMQGESPEVQEMVSRMVGLSQPQAGPQASQAAPAQSPPMEALPPAAQNAGRTIRDLSTGKRYKSDGRQWVEVR